MDFCSPLMFANLLMQKGYGESLRLRFMLFLASKKGILMKKGYDDHYESLFLRVLIEKLAKRPNDTNVTKNCPEIE